MWVENQTQRLICGFKLRIWAFICCRTQKLVLRTITAKTTPNFLMVGTFRLQWTWRVDTSLSRDWEYHLVFHWLSASRTLSPLNEPLVFRTLEVKLIQSKVAITIIYLHVMFMQWKSAYQYENSCTSKSDLPSLLPADPEIITPIWWSIKCTTKCGFSKMK